MKKTHNIFFLFGFSFLLITVFVFFDAKYTKYGLAFAVASTTCMIIANIFLARDIIKKKIREMEERQKSIDNLKIEINDLKAALHEKR